MCGLFGIVTATGTLTDRDVRCFVTMGELAQRRGSDASGIVRVDARGSVDVVKSDLPFRSLAQSVAGRHQLSAAPDVRIRALLGHSRLETHGFSASVQNNQPIVLGQWAVLHNGIVTNHRDVRGRRPHLDNPEVSSDTAAIAVLLLEWDELGRTRALDDVFGELQGEFTVIAVSTAGELVLFTNVGNLYTVLDPSGHRLLASEPRQLPKDLRSRATRVSLNAAEILVLDLELPANEIDVVEADRSADRSFSGAEGLHLTSTDLDRRFADRLAAVEAAALARAADVRRCSMCVLPETFPGIEFDEGGRCSVCAAFAPPRYLGLDALETEMRLASPDGRSVMVCLSGGRDSCYVLHLVREMGFDPVAYTYDWGMVTTAARENMARMCGALGVEHILVSPNIRKNRQRIRRALRAWLQRPDVGTLPILMAGDKPYFRFAGIVASERGGLPAVMADHPLETTGFKSMLAGARPTTSPEGGVSYRLGPSSLARMVASYGLHSVRAPGLLPSLVAEGAVGFYDYYMRDHSFVRPFSYIEWDEVSIERVLRDEYQWSAGEDRSSTSWRMGDGTAPFYNLMYLIALGMTEHDALRSNQVRAGVVSRDEALVSVASDNRVNPLGVASYFRTVDIDTHWALTHVEQFARASGLQ